MSRTSGLTHTVVLAALGAVGWVALVVLTLAEPSFLRPLEPTAGLAAVLAMAAVARLLAVRVFQRVLIALDSAFYISAAFVHGLLAAAWMVAVVLTADAVIRHFARRRTYDDDGGAWAFIITQGGLPALGLTAIGLLYALDVRYPMSDLQLAVLEPLFAVTFLVTHYAVSGSVHLGGELAGELKVKLWGDFFVRVVFAELFLVPLALAMVLGHAYQGDGLYLLLGSNCLVFNVIFRRAVVSSNKLQERIEELSVLDEVGRIISGSLERRTLLANLAKETLRLVRHSSRFMIGLVEPRNDLVAYELFDERGRSFRKIGAPRDEGLSGWVMLHREPLLLGDVQRQYGLYSRSGTYNDPRFHSWLGVPLVIYDEVIGVAAVQSETPDAYTADHLRVLTRIADQAAVALENSRLYELATVDGLTGLLVRRHFELRLEEEWARASRYGSELTLGILDLDDFKALNDTYGHQAGDQALRAVAAALRRNLRAADIAGRYGGEELAYILPKTRIDEAQIMAERIRGDLERLRVAVGGLELRLTASIGLAAFPDARAPHPSELIALADEAMYQAKRLGKNQVCVSTELERDLAPEASQRVRERGIV